MLMVVPAPHGTDRGRPQAAPAAATGRSPDRLSLFWQMMAIVAPTMSAFVGTWIWADARIMEARADARARESEARAEARARESEARAEARARESEARAAREFERIHGQLHDIFMLLAGNRGRDNDAARTPKHQTGSDGR